jgi:hypothetical protein
VAKAATLQQALCQFLDPTELDLQRQRVCARLMACRTPAMGGRQLHCDGCEHEQVQYFSCRDRHCPQCQGRAIRQWSDRQREHLLPVRYFHVVFTLPHALNGWVQLHPEVIHRLLFQAAWGTLRAFAEDPRRLGGTAGMSAVLHTWGQTLGQHVHLHCLVPGGALTGDGRWHAVRGNYLFPVRALSRRFRGRMVSGLRAAVHSGLLHRVVREGEVDTMLHALMKVEWVVYTRNCLDHTETVIAYLARYTRRIAITNARILSIDTERVTLRYTDYRTGKSNRTVTLDGAEFVRRFLLHVLPKGLMRVRHYGFLANRCRRRRLAEIREALAAAASAECGSCIPPEQPGSPNLCPECRQGTMQLIALVPREPRFDHPLSRTECRYRR